MPVMKTRTALLLPGARYPVERPLLSYPRAAIHRRGGMTHDVSWAVPEFRDSEDERAWVVARVRDAVAAAEAATGGVPPLVIAKSIGSLAAPVVRDRQLAAVWLTPIVSDQATVAALRQASRPCLMVGGTGDQFWDGEIARSITPHVLEVPGADHAMLMPGRPAESAAVLEAVVTAVEHFLDLVWA